jgi:autotransporter-associated beta strand protein
LSGFSRLAGATAGFVALISLAGSAHAQQRVLGADISYWNSGSTSTGISQANWNTAHTSGGIEFVWLRATRGGTTGVDQPQGTPGGGTSATLSHRYDDSRFVQNLIRSTSAGILTGAYHFGRPDVAGNTGADEADHFLQMAGAWMRPGYLMPVYDMEAGSGGDAMAQFALDFSNRIYSEMQIRPGIYVNGNYSQILQGATQSRRDALAKPGTYTPSVVSPAYPMLWDARYVDADYQTANPKDSFSGFYGPWDDYGDSQPWDFWQYDSGTSIPGLNAVDTTDDIDISHGDIEYVRNFLVPAVWWNDSSGDWSALANWNSGQTPVAPVTPRDQATPYATGGLPAPRLPGAAGSGVTSGQYDTVILERPSANITVTLSSGSYNIRKMYMRESLEITGGALTINYNPNYRLDNSSTVRHGGPISAQFSGPVTMSGGSLSVHTLQVDANKTFTLGGGTLTLDTMNLMPLSATPGKLVISGDVTINPLNGASAVIQKGAGSGNTAVLDLGGGTRTITVGNGAAAIDLTVSIPVANGGLTKDGAGTLALTNANSYTGNTAVQAGTLSLGFASLPNAADVLISNGAALNLNFAGTDMIRALFLNGASQAAGTWGAVGSGAQFTSPLITGAGLLQVSAFVGTPLAGDFNSDGLVDSADLAVWQSNSGVAGGVTHSQGDGNGDGVVDGADYLVWQGQLGSLPSTVAAVAGVPEPAAGIMISACAALLLASRGATLRG